MDISSLKCSNSELLFFSEKMVFKYFKMPNFFSDSQKCKSWRGRSEKSGQLWGPWYSSELLYKAEVILQGTTSATKSQSLEQKLLSIR